MMQCPLHDSPEFFMFLGSYNYLARAHKSPSPDPMEAVVADLVPGLYRESSGPIVNRSSRLFPEGGSCSSVSVYHCLFQDTEPDIWRMISLFILIGQQKRKNISVTIFILQQGLHCIPVLSYQQKTEPCLSDYMISKKWNVWWSSTDTPHSHAIRV